LTPNIKGKIYRKAPHRCPPVRRFVIGKNTLSLGTDHLIHSVCYPLASSLLHDSTTRSLSPGGDAIERASEDRARSKRLSSTSAGRPPPSSRHREGRPPPWSTHQKTPLMPSAKQGGSHEGRAEAALCAGLGAAMHGGEIPRRVWWSLWRGRALSPLTAGPRRGHRAPPANSMVR
jgi:hypothetical protein